MADTAPLKGWRTTLWNVGVVGAGAVLTYLAAHSQDVLQYIPTPYVGIGAIVIGTINQIFRNVTTTSVGTK